ARGGAAAATATRVGGLDGHAGERRVGVDADVPVACDRVGDVDGFVVAVEVRTIVIDRQSRLRATLHVEVAVAGAARHHDRQRSLAGRNGDLVVLPAAGRGALAGEGHAIGED